MILLPCAHLTTPYQTLAFRSPIKLALYIANTCILYFSRQENVCLSGDSSNTRSLLIALTRGHTKPSGSLTSSPCRSHTPQRTKAGPQRRRRSKNSFYKTGSLATWTIATDTHTSSCLSGTSTLKCRYARSGMQQIKTSFGYLAVHFTIILPNLKYRIVGKLWWALNSANQS